MLLALISLTLWPLYFGADSIQLMSSNENFMSVIAGFTVRLQCSIFKCGTDQPTVSLLSIKYSFNGLKDCVV